MANAGKKTRGRQKIEMKRIEKDEDRLITFSKRRSGIYKKASELVTLTGAEVGILVFSPSGKPFTFGHPSIEAVANRFLGMQPPENDTTHPLVEAHRKVRIDELNQVHNELLRKLEAEKERGKILKQMLRGNERKGWWEASVDELNVEELHRMHASLEELHQSLFNQICQMTSGTPGASTSTMPPPPNPCQQTNPFLANNPNEAGPSSAPYPYGYGYFKPGQF
ncbi:agamous-like MADS-box protein AGL61 [Mangifera indica]|uniref:agamous-like MADS-box protein AGL61 n=1 Tax=Mangifera indica TaxID=29780 RepID=UPI001CF9D5F7|nr:agamous-like MADS-box protein AGL61 [Mangifera indica]